MSATRDGRPHRYINTKQPGAIVFVTTTCLDFARAFQRSEMRERAVISILRDSQRYGTNLHAFVVMTHHIHLLVKCADNRNVSWLMQRMKSNLAKLALPWLDDFERSELATQSGLNQRSFWKPSFRALSVDSEHVFGQKVRYIHENPVRAKLAERPDDYRWSSSRLWNSGLWHDEYGLDLDRVLEEFNQAITTSLDLG